MSKNFFATIFAIISAITTMANVGHAQTVDLNLSQEDVRIIGEAFRDSSGYSLAYGDIDNDTFADLVIGAPTAGDSVQGKVFIIYGDADFIPPSPQVLNLPGPFPPHTITIITGANRGDRFGWSVATGDIDGDGFADVIIGAPFSTSNNNQGEPVYPEGGKTYVVYSLAGSLKLMNLIDVASSPPGRVTEINGDRNGSRSGWSVASGYIDGDINLNQFGDVVIGAPFSSDATGLTEKGITYVVYGQPGGLPTLPGQHFSLATPSSPITQILGENPGDHLGWSVSSGNINDDRSDDVITGAPHASSSRGRTYVVTGGVGLPSTIFDLASPAPKVTVEGINPGDRSGWSVSNGNVDSPSGFADLIIGAPFRNTIGGTEAGETYLFFGPVPPSTISTASAHFTMSGDHFRDHSGWSVAGGDFDNDKLDDIIIGAPDADNFGTRPVQGEAYVVFGQSILDKIALGTITIPVAQSNLIILGDDLDDLTGFSVAAGNLNGAGGEDLTVGAPGANAQDSRGHTYVIYGCELKADAGEDRTICEGQSTVIGGSPTAIGGTPPYTFSWSPNNGTLNSTTIPNPTASPVVTTTYEVTVTDAHGCKAKDNVTVTVTPRPTVSVDSPTICFGQSTTLTATTNAASPSFLWNTGDTTPSITVSPAVTTTFTVTVTDGVTGCQNSASGTVTVNPLPTVSVNSPAICIGESATLTATTDAASPSFLWSNGATTPSITVVPTVTTTFTVTVTDGVTGCQNSASGTVTVNPLPTVTVSVNPEIICAGQSAILTATTDAASPSFLWSNGATTPSISVSPSATTTFTVTVTDGVTGCQNSASGTVTVNPAPTVSVNSATICFGQSATLTATTSAASPSFLWNTGETTPSITVAPGVTTTFTVTVTDGVTGCQSSASGTVTVNPLPTVTVNSPAICIGGSATLTATTSAASPSFLWNTGETTPSITVTPSVTTTFTVTVTDGATGCQNTGSGTVTVNPLPTVSVNSPTICVGQSATLTATTDAASPSFLWSTGATTPSITVTPTVTTTYTVTVTDGVTGCQGSASGTVTVNPVPTVSVNSATICAEQSTTLTATTNATSPSFLWSTGETTPSITVAPAVTTTFTVTVTDGVTGCQGSASGTVTVNPLPAVSVNSATSCAGQSTTLTATTSAASPSFLWNTGETTPSITVSPAITTTFTVTVTDGVTGCKNSASGTVTVNPLPTATVSGSTNICIGQSATISVTLTGTAPWDITWSDGFLQTASASPATRTVNPSSTTTFTVTTVTDANGCSNSGTGSAVVTVNPLPTAIVSGGGTTCAGQSVAITINMTGTAPWVLNWSDGFTQTVSTSSATRNVSPSTTTTFTVTTVTDANGCANTGTGSAVVTVNLVSADFTFTPAAPCVGDEIKFFDGSSSTSGPIVSWSWSFGDASPSDIHGGMSNLQNPTYAYKAVGTYTVTLTATDVNGCKGTTTKNITVIQADHVPPFCGFTIDADNNIVVTIGDLGDNGTADASGIAEINVLSNINGMPPVFDRPFTPCETKYIRLTIKPIDPAFPAIFNMEVKDCCGNTTVCDPAFLRATVGGPAQYEFKLSSMDKYLYVDNDGLAKIDIRINDRPLEFVADPIRRYQQGHRQYMPLHGDICIDISSYMTEAENDVVLKVTGPSGTSARIVFADVKFSTTSPVVLPEDFTLYQNYPNPFNPSTTIEYTVPATFKDGAKVELVIYNALGQRVKTLENDIKAPNLYFVHWNGTDEFGRVVPTGIYLYRIKVGNFTATKRMSLLK